MTQRPIIVSHLSQQSKHAAIYADCKRCYRRPKLDLVALMRKYGDMAVDDLRRRLSCGACGSRDVGIIKSFDTGHRGYTNPAHGSDAKYEC